MYDAVSLNELLDVRERRAARQRTLLGEHALPLVCFTMNIAGAVKNSPLIGYAFRAGISMLRERLGVPIFFESEERKTGCEAFLVYDLPAQTLKTACLAVEEGAVERLYDLDVLDTEGKKLSRGKPRRCLLCGRSAADCARSRRHGLEAVISETQRRLREFAQDDLARRATEALCREVEQTPKPGLVDRRNTGAHRDMDTALMCRSAELLRPFFAGFVRRGLNGAAVSELRDYGIGAETAMLHATGGVNTHKGALYSLALLLSALGRSLAGQEGDVFRIAAQIAAGLPVPQGTHGASVRERYALPGVRSEAIAGFPTLRRLLLLEDPQRVLLTAMAGLADSNLVYRGGIAGLTTVQRAAQNILLLPETQWTQALERMDDKLIAGNLSPGGSADLLALWYFMKSLP